MIANRQQPLEIASRVLRASTIDAVKRSPSFHLQGWKILDRWAYNSPTKLTALETQGEMLLLERLLVQQQIELEALTRATSPISEGLTENEVLQLNDIQTEL